MNDVSKPKLAMAAHRQAIRVYFEDTDAAGIVYYANYLKFAERARTDMLRELGVSHAEMMKRDGLVLVVRRCEIDYLRPAKLDDLLTVEPKRPSSAARRSIFGSACCAATRCWPTSRCWWCASVPMAGRTAFPIMCAGFFPA